jgi:hypothetical protein
MDIAHQGKLQFSTFNKSREFNFEDNHERVTPANVAEKAKSMRDFALDRVGFFPTPNILFPFGCDFQFSNRYIF